MKLVKEIQETETENEFLSQFEKRELTKSNYYDTLQKKYIVNCEFSTETLLIIAKIEILKLLIDYLKTDNKILYNKVVKKYNELTDIKIV